ncbi:c-type cytochrome [Acidisoma sp. C75]
MRSVPHLAAVASLIAVGAASSLAGASPAHAANFPPQVPMCASCHGQGGISSSPNFPNLAGQKEGYLVNALEAYKNGTRHGSTAGLMIGIAGQLSDADIKALAAYYAGLKAN